MTLDDMLIDCCTRLNYPPDLAVVEPKVKARLTAFLNQTQYEILGQPSFVRLLYIESVLQAEAGVSVYGLPDYYERILSVVDPINQRRLSVMSMDAYRRYLPNPLTQQGTPVSYAFNGWGAMELQPTSLEDVYVYSEAADDGTTVSCWAIVPDPPAFDGWMKFTAVLNAAAGGVLFVPAGGNARPAYMTDVQVSKPVVARSVELLANKPPTRFLSRIMQGAARARHCQIVLAPTPSGRPPFLVTGQRPVIPMEGSGDTSVIPPSFHYVLSAGARMKEYELRGDTARYAVAKREHDTGMSFLNAFVSSMPDGGDVMVPDDGRFGGTSVLGPWFPVSRYRGF
jgi:hypothetical protein